VAHALVLLGAVGSLLVVAFVLLGTHPARGGAELARVLLGVLAIGASWLLVHTVYWLGYARLYYTLPIGGLDFHPAGDERPQFSDFAYLAFTVGMTFQVSDTEVTTARLRRVVLGQALISFVFVAVVLAVTINVLAGLAQNG
jgi:uncharacterized membrane protein